MRRGNQRAVHAGLRFAFSAAAYVAACATTLLISDGASAEVVPPATDFRFEFIRAVGLPEFELPEDNLRLLEVVLNRYAKAIADEKVEDPGLLSETLQLLPLGKNASLWDEKNPNQRGEGDNQAPPLEVAPLEVRTAGFVGVYSTVLGKLAARADELAGQVAAREAPAETADGQSKAAQLRLLRDVATQLARVNDQTRRPLSIERLLVGFRSESGVVVFDQAVPEGDRKSLPTIATQFAGIETESLPALEQQVEAYLESLYETLDFTVGADVRSLRPQESQILFRVGYVGPAKGPAIPVSGFELEFVDSDYKAYSESNKESFPNANEVLEGTTIALYRVKGSGGTEGSSYLTDWVPHPAEDPVTYSLSAIPPDERLSVSAIQRVMERVLETLKSEKYDLMGVFVDAEPGQLDMTAGGTDIRKGKSTFKVVALPGVVGDVRVVASGDRVDEAERVNPPYGRFDRIRKRSPFQPDDPTKQILKGKELQNYLDRASRHPNRRVDAAVTAFKAPVRSPQNSVVPAPASTGAEAAPEGTASSEGSAQPLPGTIGLDYLVTELRPWSVFAQVSNTGTQSTGEWQERFGFFHSDLLHNDEILSIEYVTTNFKDTHGVNAYFDAPLGDSERIRWKVFGGWNQYTATDVGNSTAQFEGESPFLAGELSINLWQSGKYFFDAVGGVRWFDVYVNNRDFVDVEGHQDFFVPYVGARLQSNARDKTTDFGVFFDASVADVTSVDLADQERLGRLDPDRDWMLLRWDLYQSLYLDPFFQKDYETATLGHELAFRFRGQYSFGNRLIPQQMGVAGGLYTVRGYPESVVAGDDVMLFTGEYRLHLPQILGFDSSPEPILGMGEPFRFRPQFGYGATDWDLILRAFIDIGRSENSDRKSYEFDETLVGAGVGVQLQVLRNLDLRLDLGFPLQDLESRNDLDSARLSFVGTLAF
jgi:hemolysin activation/secretion protein